jgi:hypothetical protein
LPAEEILKAVQIGVERVKELEELVVGALKKDAGRRVTEVR